MKREYWLENNSRRVSFRTPIWGYLMRTPSLLYLGVNWYHPTRTRTQTLRSDQCLDAVACEGSRLIRTTWMLCLELLNVDWTLVGPAREAVGHCIA